MRGMIILALAFAPGVSPQVFEADRDYLFRACATMPIYGVDRPYGTAVRKGNWAFGATQKQGAIDILDAWTTYGDGDPNHLAYVLATARRESAGTFLPVREASACGSDEECRERAIDRMLKQRAERRNVERRKRGLEPLPAKMNYALPNQAGKRFYGRGYNQLTGSESYRRAGGLINVDLLDDPDKALEPQTSSRILIEGMLKGWFGSRKPLSHYLDGASPRWDEARATTNPGSPNAAITGSYARDFRKCLRSAS